MANVFVLAQALDPVTESVSPQFSNERNTLGMMGSGPIEMLAREMSTELIAIRESARAVATASEQPETRDLVAKGVDFGSITVMPDGKVDPTQIEGVDWDLIIKPFHQKGAVVSIRQFTNNALNHHHGIQSVERFGQGVDADQDGVVDEATAGDVTALTIFQAALNTPGQRMPTELARREAVDLGEELFETVGCVTCHLPVLDLDNESFSEPNPFNPPGNLRLTIGANAVRFDETKDLNFQFMSGARKLVTPANLPKTLTTMPFTFDMTQEGSSPRLEVRAGGGVIVRAYTDLKRHDLNDGEINHFANEQLPQGALNGFASPEDFTVAPQPRPTQDFLTRKLWDVGNSDPFGHRGDLTMMTEAIEFHGGEARPSRDAFFARTQADQDAIIEFLKTLQVLPAGSPPIIEEKNSLQPDWPLY